MYCVLSAYCILHKAALADDLNIIIQVYSARIEKNERSGTLRLEKLVALEMIKLNITLAGGGKKTASYLP